MQLTREDRKKRLEASLTILNKRLEVMTYDIKNSIKSLEDQLQMLELKGFRVIFDSTEGHNYGKYYDFTIHGWGSVGNASKYAREAADKFGGTVEEIFFDTPKPVFDEEK